MAYLDLLGFKALTVAPAVYVDQIEAAEAGWTLAQLEYWSRRIDARLKKRYAVPFSELTAETPTVVKGWLADIVTPRIYKKRGVDATDEQYADVVEDAKTAWGEVREAADSPDNLFELPLKQTSPGETAVTKGSPLVYTEGSPYEWSELQRKRADDEGVI